MTTAVAIRDDTETKRQAALLKAVGLDRVPPEQRELAMAIADRYALDLLLKHVVLIDGRPYVTRDGLLHIAHRSGQFDGIEVTDPVLDGEFWRSTAAVYRKDMTRPFRYPGRYPAKGGNQRFAPEMAVKVAEVMALRRAFDVSAPVLEERWDMEAATGPETAPEPPRSTAEVIAARRASLTTPVAPAPLVAGQRPVQADTMVGGPSDPAAAEPSPVAIPSVAGEGERCESTSPYEGASRCAKAAGHTGTHRNRDKESWS